MDNIVILKNLGFSEYEARTYVALTELGPSTAKEISNYSKLPRNKTYDMLRKLELKNRIISLPVTPRKYRILYINQLKEIIENKKESLEKLEHNLDTLYCAIHLSNRP